MRPGPVPWGPKGPQSTACRVLVHPSESRAAGGQPPHSVPPYDTKCPLSRRSPPIWPPQIGGHGKIPPGPADSIPNGSPEVDRHNCRRIQEIGATASPDFGLQSAPSEVEVMCRCWAEAPRIPPGGRDGSPRFGDRSGPSAWLAYPSRVVAPPGHDLPPSLPRRRGASGCAAAARPLRSRVGAWPGKVERSHCQRSWGREPSNRFYDTKFDRRKIYRNCFPQTRLMMRFMRALQVVRVPRPGDGRNRDRDGGASETGRERPGRPRGLGADGSGLGRSGWRDPGPSLDLRGMARAGDKRVLRIARPSG
jgi:hypothetical protein